MTDQDLWYAGYCMDEDEHDSFEEDGLPEFPDDDWDDSDDPYDD